MKKILAVAAVLAFAAAVTGAAWAAHKPLPKSTKHGPPPSRHNPRKPGPGSKEMPGGHGQGHPKASGNNNGNR